MMHFGGGSIVMWILALVVVGILIYLVMQNVRSHEGGDTPHETPLEVLQKRYARGEITREEFDEMKRSL